MAFSNKTLNSTMASGRLARGSSSPSHSIHSSNGEDCATTLKFPVKCLSRSGEGGRRKEGGEKERGVGKEGGGKKGGEKERGVGKEGGGKKGGEKERGAGKEWGRGKRGGGKEGRRGGRVG